MILSLNKPVVNAFGMPIKGEKSKEAFVIKNVIANILCMESSSGDPAYDRACYVLARKVIREEKDIELTIEEINLIVGEMMKPEIAKANNRMWFAQIYEALEVSKK